MPTMAPPRVRRTIRSVPALFVATMQDEGKLPAPPTTIDRSKFGFRAPNIADMMKYEWAAQWHGDVLDDAKRLRSATGLVGYRDGYDFHTASDVREIIYAAGSPRAIVEIFRYLKGEADLLGRRVMGSFDCDNAGMRGLVQTMGAQSTRCVFETGGAACPV